MSDVPSPLPLLIWDNVELANAARTVSYISRGLAQSTSGTFEVAPDGYPCALLYRIGGFVGAPGYASPSADPAPWYDATLPESGDFLGFIIDDWSGFDDSTVGRSAQSRLGGIEGAQLGPQRQVGRVMTIKGFLVAASSEGNEYGLRWLTSQLAAPDCDQCATGAIQLWTSCPPDDGSDDDFSRRVIYDVGLTDGPRRVGSVITDRYCDIQEIEFTLVAENPYLYRPPVECLPAEILGEAIACDPEAPDICTWLFGPAGEPHCCSISGSSYGTVGTIITIDSPDGIGGVTIGLYPSSSSCPPEDAEPVRELEIERVPPGDILVIDSAQRTITLFEPDDGGGFTATDGTDLLLLPIDETFDWIEAADCEGEPTCVCVRTSHPCSGGASTTVKIETQIRER